MDRDQLLRTATSGTQLRTAEAERSRFENFRQRFDLDEDIEAVSLYLTALAGTLDGPAIRRRLQALDFDRRQRGVSPWLAHDDVRALLRGLHATSSRGGNSRSWYDPLYIELVHALIDATYVPSLEQRRARAAMVVADGTGLGVAALSRLTWDRVRVTRRGVAVTVVQRVGRGQPVERSWNLDAKPGDEACPVRVLDALPHGRFVLVEKDGAWDRDRLYAQMTPLVKGQPGPARLRDALAQALMPSPSQIRDRALLTIGFGIGLRTGETSRLLQKDLEMREHGLVVTVSGRRHVTSLPRHPDKRLDAVTAWDAWLACMASQGKAAQLKPAFPSCNHSVIEGDAMGAQALNLVIHRRCAQAALNGRYVWTSLRSGMIRTALRSDEREWAVAYQADLTSLGSVRRHERRENLLRDSVAGCLGL